MQHLTLVIFGASGDLTARKLVPALFHQYAKGRLPQNTHIVGVSRRPFTDDEYRTQLTPWVKQAAGSHFDAAAWERFAPGLHYVAGDATAKGGLDKLQAWFQANEPAAGADRVYYLSVAPELVPGIVNCLGEYKMNNWIQLIAIVTEDTAMQESSPFCAYNKSTRSISTIF